MKKRKIVYLITGIFIVILALVVWWQFENIKSVYYYFKYSGEDIDTMIRQSDKDVEEYLKSNPEYSVRPSTEVEEKLHQEGIISDEELVAVITGQTNVEELIGTEIGLDENKKFVDLQSGDVLPKDKVTEMKDEVTRQRQQNKSENKSDMSKDSNHDGTSQNKDSKPIKDNKPIEGSDDNKSDEKSSDSKTEKKPSDSPDGNKEVNQPVGDTGNTSQNADTDQVSQYIAQMYVLKSSFSAQVGALYQEAIAAYSSLPKSERNESGKSGIIKQLYPRAMELEASCDSQVSSLLSQLEAQLVAEGKSTEIVTKMRTAYYQEKSLVKAQYMNEL